MTVFPAPASPAPANQRNRIGSQGIALVQVLIMSVLLTILASGLLKMTFGTHVMVSKVRHTDIRKQWVEACMARKIGEWSATGAACTAGTCTFGAGNPTVTVTCPSGQAVFVVNN